jgi:glycosyltransferase involved in cell wall biosynthesis
MPPAAQKPIDDRAGAAPSVSVILPVFNGQEHLREAVASGLDQSDGSVEIIAVDDGSTDATGEILRELAEVDPRMRVITLERNSTAFQARRVGALESRGKYLLFLDGDDTLRSDAVATIRRRASSGADLIHFGAVIRSRDGRRHRSFEAKLRPRHARLHGAAILDELFLHRKSFEGHLWNKAYRADFAKQVLSSFPSDARVPRSNDLPVSLVFAAEAQTYVSTRQRLYTYRFGSGAVSDGLISPEQFAKLVNFRPSFDVAQARLVDLRLDPDLRSRVLDRLQAQFITRSVRLIAQVAQPRGDELDLLLRQWPAREVLSRIPNWERPSEV